MIFWDVRDIDLDAQVNDVTLHIDVAETLSHYDPPTGIEFMVVESTFIVG